MDAEAGVLSADQQVSPMEIKLTTDEKGHEQQKQKQRSDDEISLQTSTNVPSDFGWYERLFSSPVDDMGWAHNPAIGWSSRPVSWKADQVGERPRLSIHKDAYTVVFQPQEIWPADLVAPVPDGLSLIVAAVDENVAANVSSDNAAEEAEISWQQILSQGPQLTPPRAVRTSKT